MIGMAIHWGGGIIQYSNTGNDTKYTFTPIIKRQSYAEQNKTGIKKRSVVHIKYIKIIPTSVLRVSSVEKKKKKKKLL